jgi:hypothetical protein
MAREERGVDVQRRSRGELQQIDRDEFAVGRQRRPPEGGDAALPGAKAPGLLVQSQVTGRGRDWSRARPQAATRRLVGAADDQQGVDEVREPSEERDAARRCRETRCGPALMPAAASSFTAGCLADANDSSSDSR